MSVVGTRWAHVYILPELGTREIIVQSAGANRAPIDTSGVLKGEGESLRYPNVSHGSVQ
jgi:hypothetical protein